MVCPLRFVLVGISLLIASLAWWRCQEAEEQHYGVAEQRGGMREGGQEKAAARTQRSSWADGGALLLDMLSGRYLYRAATQGLQGGGDGAAAVAPKKAR